MTAALKSPAPSSAARRLIRTPAFEEASARLQFLVDAGSRVGLLVGGSGIGKTTLLDRFAEKLRGEGCLTAQVNAAGLGPEELIGSIAAKLQTPVEHDWNLFRLWRAVNDRLYELRFLREQAVILVDDAGKAGSDVLVHFYRLLHADAAADARLSVVLATTRDTAPRLGRSLLELVDLRIELGSWTVAETRALIDATDKAGQGARFDDAAVERAWRLTGGVPRAVVRLAELCRLAAEADGGNLIDAATVEAVANEFDLRVAAA